MAKSGWPVLGQRQVNSGICRWITKSRFFAGFGNTSSDLEGRAVNLLPSAVSFDNASLETNDLAGDVEEAAEMICFSGLFAHGNHRVDTIES